MNDKIKEIWKNIPGYEGMYQASNLGRIKSLERFVDYRIKGYKKLIKEKIISCKKDIYGYSKVSLRKDKNSKTYKGHRLIALTFIPNLENKPFINHINGDKMDNRVENLEWVTSKENTAHAFNTGLMNPAKGESHSKVLKEEDIRSIRKLRLEHNKPYKEISEIFNISKPQLCAIVKFKSWKHVI